MSYTERRCGKCDRTMPITDFTVDNRPNGINGRHRFCRSCKNSMQAERRAKWTPEEREKYRAGQRAQYRRQIAEDPNYVRRQYDLRRAAIIENGEAFQESERVKKATRRWYIENSSRVLSRDKECRQRLVGILGGKCAKCDYDADMRALVLDHRRGDGHLDRKRLGNKIARYYINHLEEARANLQVLCCNCNTIKASAENEHNRSRRIAKA